MYEGAKVERNDDTNRALISHDLIYRKKALSIDGTFNNYDSRTVLGLNNDEITGVEKKFPAISHINHKLLATPEIKVGYMLVVLLYLQGKLLSMQIIGKLV